MKIYRFYLNKKKIKKTFPRSIWGSLMDSVGNGKNDYPLYALTNRKALGKLFQAQRNMKFFLLRESEEDKEVWKDYASQNRTAVLDFTNLHTKGEKDGTETTVSVLMPSSEEIYLYSLTEYGINPEIYGKYFGDLPKDILLYQRSDRPFPFPGLFTHKISNDLGVLGYQDMYYWYGNTKIYRDWAEEFGTMMATGMQYDQVPVLQPDPDEFQIYITLYGALYRSYEKE